MKWRQRHREPHRWSVQQSCHTGCCRKQMMHQQHYPQEKWQRLGTTNCCSGRSNNIGGSSSNGNGSSGRSSRGSSSSSSRAPPVSMLFTADVSIPGGRRRRRRLPDPASAAAWAVCGRCLALTYGPSVTSGGRHRPHHTPYSDKPVIRVVVGGYEAEPVAAADKGTHTDTAKTRARGPDLKAGP